MLLRVDLKRWQRTCRPRTMRDATASASMHWQAKHHSRHLAPVRPPDGGSLRGLCLRCHDEPDESWSWWYVATLEAQLLDIWAILFSIYDPIDNFCPHHCIQPTSSKSHASIPSLDFEPTKLPSIHHLLVDLQWCLPWPSLGHGRVVASFVSFCRGCG